MQQKAVDEGMRRQGERALLIAVGRLAHPQAHLVRIHAEDALIRDRHPVRIAAQIFQYLPGPAQRLFRIHHPLMGKEPAQQRAPRLRVERRRTLGRPLLPLRLEGIDELAAEHLRERLDWKQEAALGAHPFACGRQRPAGHQRMDMHMPPQILLPRMQHQRERRGSTEPARVRGKLGEGGRDGGEQRLVEGTGTLSDQAVQLVRQGEHQMEVGHRQQFAPSLDEPGFLGAGLAQRAMAVAAGVIDVARGAAGLAGLDMAAELGGAAGDDGAPDLRLGHGQRMRGEIGRGMAAQDVGQARTAGCRGHAGAL